MRRLVCAHTHILSLFLSLHSNLRSSLKRHRESVIFRKHPLDTRPNSLSKDYLRR